MNEMTDFQNTDPQNEGYPQLSPADTGWTDEERQAMRERGFDDMDIQKLDCPYYHCIKIME